MLYDGWQTLIASNDYFVSCESKKNIQKHRISADRFVYINVFLDGCSHENLLNIIMHYTLTVPTFLNDQSFIECKINVKLGFSLVQKPSVINEKSCYVTTTSTTTTTMLHRKKSWPHDWKMLKCTSFSGEFTLNEHCSFDELSSLPFVNLY